MNNPNEKATHIAVRANDLMYKGCEPHWKCVVCGECVPFHCWNKAEFEQMKCRGKEKHNADKL